MAAMAGVLNRCCISSVPEALEQQQQQQLCSLGTLLVYYLFSIGSSSWPDHEVFVLDSATPVLAWHATGTVFQDYVVGMKDYIDVRQ